MSGITRATVPQRDPKESIHGPRLSPLTRASLAVMDALIRIDDIIDRKRASIETKRASITLQIEMLRQEMDDLRNLEQQREEIRSLNASVAA